MATASWLALPFILFFCLSFLRKNHYTFLVTSEGFEPSPQFYRDRFSVCCVCRSTTRSFLVLKEGFEPSRLSAMLFESIMSAIPSLEHLINHILTISPYYHLYIVCFGSSEGIRTLTTFWSQVFKTCVSAIPPLSQYHILFQLFLYIRLQKVQLYV